MLRPLPILFLGDVLCTRDLFAAQIAAFGRGREIITPDMAAAGSLGELAARVLAGAPERFALCGISLGGTVALEIMRRAPERVDRLALISSRASPDSEGEVAGRRALVALGLARGVADVMRTLLPRLVHLSRLADADLVDLLLRMSDAVGAEGFARQIEVANDKPDSRPTLATIFCPTVVIVGDSEVLMPQGASQEIAAGIVGARLHVIPRCGHLPPLERPDLVNEILRDWLDEG